MHLRSEVTLIVEGQAKVKGHEYREQMPEVNLILGGQGNIRGHAKVKLCS